MICHAEVTFRHRLDPFPWKFEGREGTAYSFEAIDADDSKVRISVTEDVYHRLASAQKGDKVTCTVIAQKPKVWNSTLEVKSAAKAG